VLYQDLARMSTRCTAGKGQGANGKGERITAGQGVASARQSPFGPALRGYESQTATAWPGVCGKGDRNGGSGEGKAPDREARSGEGRRGVGENGQRGSGKEQTGGELTAGTCALLNCRWSRQAMVERRNCLRDCLATAEGRALPA